MQSTVQNGLLQFYGKQRVFRSTGYAKATSRLMEQRGFLRQLIDHDPNVTELSGSYKYDKRGNLSRFTGERQWSLPPLSHTLEGIHICSELVEEFERISFPVFNEVVYPTLHNTDFASGWKRFESAVVDMAELVGYITTFDIEDFYSSVTIAALERVFERFGVQIGTKKRVLGWASSCRHGLPLHHPLSEVLAMAVLQPLDERLGGLSVDWVRLMDDGRIRTDTRGEGEYALDQVRKILLEFNFKLNDTKSFVHEPHQAEWIAQMLTPRTSNPSRWIRRSKSRIRSSIGFCGYEVEQTLGSREGKTKADEPLHQVDFEQFIRDFGGNRIVSVPSIERYCLEVLRGNDNDLQSREEVLSLVQARPYNIEVLARRHRCDNWRLTDAASILLKRVHTFSHEALLICESVSSAGLDPYEMSLSVSATTTSENCRLLRLAVQHWNIVPLEIQIQRSVSQAPRSELVYEIAERATREDGKRRKMLLAHLQKDDLGPQYLEVIVQR